MPVWVQIVLACVGSSGLFTLIQFFITRHDKKKGEIADIKNHLAEIDKRMDKEERDSIRIQMLLIMSDYPEEKQQLMTLAERYFVAKKGNWYMTSIFSNYLTQNGIPKPSWFNQKGNSDI